MRLDVITHGGDRYKAFSNAHSAQRLITELPRPKLLPPIRLLPPAVRLVMIAASIMIATLIVTRLVVLGTEHPRHRWHDEIQT